VEEIKIPRILNKEILLLAGLALVAFGVFVFTRQMAAKEQRLEAKIAAVWFERGMQYMQSGETDKAIQSFRKATADIADNQKYVMALANALAVENHDAEAQQLLLRLREPDPENAEINIQLARLAAKQGDVQEAVHYYQNALYGRWPADQLDRRRKLRIELIRFLLDHQQRDLASSELVILQSRTPPSAPAHMEVARLFAEADDQRNALLEYSEAARLDSHNVEALTGAGETAFEARDYGKAEQYLRAALDVNPESEKTRQLLELIEAVQNEDPLAPQLTAVERQNRLRADFERSMARLDRCLSQTPESKASAELKSLKEEALAMEPKLNSKLRPPDSDAVRSGVELVFRMQQAASGYCGKPSVEDQALLLIGRQHHGEQP
jgi:tetratricopeptide (TPR) repeat protein